MLLVHNFFLADAIQQLHDEIDSCLRLSAFPPICLLGIDQHTSFCTHSCISLNYPQYWVSSIGGTYHSGWLAGGALMRLLIGLVKDYAQNFLQAPDE